MYYNNRYFMRSADMNLIAYIAKAINGEYSAIICYELLSRLAPNEEARNQILEIRNDEISHYQTFSQIYASLTGKQPTPQLVEQCETSYEAGLKASFKDQQKTTDFYLDISEMTNDPYIKDRFRRASADEQNHAVWFLYFMTTDKPDIRQIRQPVTNYGAIGALQAPTFTLSSILTYAIQDEYLAQARYDTILQKFGDVRTFVQIKEAEKRHINALLPLFERYQTPLPENIAETLVTVPDTLKNAYAQGVQGEIDNIAMYDKFLTLNLPPDMIAVFTQIRDASRNHLAAFERGLARA